MNLDKHINRFSEVITHYMPVIFSALLVLIIGWWLIKRVSILSQKAFERRKLEISLTTFLSSLISIGLKIILIVTVAGMLGIGTASFVTILGAASLAVGLALQGSLSNFAGGVLILIFKPFKVGDVIEAHDQRGEVKEIQIFNTIMLTPENRTVIFPNGALSNGTIVNISKHGNLRAEIQLNVSIDSNIKLVKSIIQKELEINSYVLKNPEPLILVSKITDDAINFSIRPFCVTGQTNGMVSSLNEQLIEALTKNNINMPVQNIQFRNI